jgi:6-phosphogluconolactonase/glucosamine-6-phosphate isomerase/deaminase
MIKFIQISSKKKIGEQVAKIFIKQVKHKPKSVFLLATGSSPIYTYKSIIKDRVAHKTD